MDCICSGNSGSASINSAGNCGAECQFHTPSPTASRNTWANGSLIKGFSLRVSAARADATPSAVAPTLSVISQESLSVLALLIPGSLPRPLGRHEQGLGGGVVDALRGRAVVTGHQVDRLRHRHVPAVPTQPVADILALLEIPQVLDVGDVPFRFQFDHQVAHPLHRLGPL